MTWTAVDTVAPWGPGLSTVMNRETGGEVPRRAADEPVRSARMEADPLPGLP
jgi:hypothetical protein